MLKATFDKKTPWQTALINAVTTPKELFEILELDLSLLDQAEAAAKLFPLKVPREFIERMKKRDMDDPLLRQVLPIGVEQENIPGFTKDPLQEKNANPIPGLLHKYTGRVLLTPTGACAINCRYCFRRHFPYAENNPGTAGWNQALDYIMRDETIHEVILSGGDPLVLSDTHLQGFTDKLSKISHIKRLRIHSRIPIVLPERITSDFITWLQNVKFKTILVVHCNHPNEINSPVLQAMEALRKSGVTLLNQSVLLKGINDNVKTLITLSEVLFNAGIQPYYLHVLDKVQGAAHFDLEQTVAKELHWQMSQKLSGYLVPKLVSEQPGAPAKMGVYHPEFYTD